ncbi:MAG: hypothetical protein ACOC78_01650 [Actinomycetota bacterium]
MRILFICTGNICRSVMAESFMRSGLAAGNHEADVKLNSAGLEAEEGMAPPREVIDVMRDYHLDVSEHRAHRLMQEDVDGADLILTMTLHNTQRFLTVHQEAVNKAFTLREFVIQGERKGGELEDKEPESRLRELRGAIRNLEGFMTEDGDIGKQLRLFFLHYFHIYDHELSVDDPLGQSQEFMKRTAEEIRQLVDRMMGSDLLALL